ncbi:RING finger protein 150 isoform 4-T4 [Trichechus inunguis]
MAMSLIQACRSLALSTWLLSFCFVHLLCLDFTVAEKEEWYTAFVNITYAEPAPDPGAGAAGGGGAELHTEKTECGRYGEHSPKQDARGEVVMASSAHDRLACDPNTKFAVPPQGKNWIALIPKGNCTYRDKIRNAFLQNASAVVIFNVGSNTNETITMSHAGVEDIVAIMIPEPKGKEIVSLLERNITVTMYITIGTRNLQKYVSRTSVVFVSISFIVLMIISLAWLVFYYIQRFRYANARDRNQRRLGDAAKKAISKLQVRTIKKGDKETEPDFDNCAVCIEGYKPNDVVRILPCRTNKYVLEEVQPECSLEARMVKLRLRLTYFGHVIRRDQSLEKDIMLGKVEGQQRRGRPSTRWIETVAATMGSSITTIVRMA